MCDSGLHQVKALLWAGPMALGQLATEPLRAQELRFEDLGVQPSEDIADRYPGSALYAKPVEVIPHVWSAIGATAPPTYENSGHNNNLSFIVTGDGVIVVNGGAAYILAEALHAEIHAVTDQPVRLVINENGQGQAMLGNAYWAAQGVPILAHVDAARAFKEYGPQILANMERYNRD